MYDLNSLFSLNITSYLDNLKKDEKKRWKKPFNIIIPYNFIFEKYYIPVRIKNDVAKEEFRSTVCCIC